MKIQTLLASSLILSTAHAVSEQEQLTYQFDFDSATVPNVVVDNIWGDVRISTHQENTVLVSIESTRLAPDERRFEESRSKIYLDITETAEGVSLVVEGVRNNWRSKNRCRGCELELQFDLIVPARANVDASTVNDGDVEVLGVTGRVDTSNINGNVAVSNAVRCGNFETINGDIDVDFAQSPDGECRYETINGDITVRFPEDADADLSLDFNHGSIRSEIDVTPVAIPAKFETDESDGTQRYRYRQTTGVRLGRGGTEHQFKSMNGDLRIGRH